MNGNPILERVPDMFCVADMKGYFTAVNSRFSQTVGHSEMELLSRPFVEFVHPEDQARTVIEFERLKAGFDTIRFVNRYRCADGSFKWIAWSCRAPSPGEPSIYAAARDITQERLEYESIRADQHLRQLLLREINHRARNNFSALLGLIQLSRRAYASVDEFADAVRQRVEAMASVHELLSQNSYVSVPLDQLLYELIPPSMARQFVIVGPRVDVAPRQVNAIGMIINELIHNSLKHGSLSSSVGTVDVSWAQRDSRNGGIELDFRWCESGGPEIADPHPRPHLGTGLIEGLVHCELRGIVNLAFPASGAVHHIRFWLDVPDLQPADQLRLAQ